MPLCVRVRARRGRMHAHNTAAPAPQPPPPPVSLGWYLQPHPSCRSTPHPKHTHTHTHTQNTHTHIHTHTLTYPSTPHNKPHSNTTCDYQRHTYTCLHGLDRRQPPPCQLAPPPVPQLTEVLVQRVLVQNHAGARVPGGWWTVGWAVERVCGSSSSHVCLISRVLAGVFGLRAGSL